MIKGRYPFTELSSTYLTFAVLISNYSASRALFNHFSDVTWAHSWPCRNTNADRVICIISGGLDGRVLPFAQAKPTARQRISARSPCPLTAAARRLRGAPDHPQSGHPLDPCPLKVSEGPSRSRLRSSRVARVLIIEGPRTRRRGFRAHSHTSWRSVYRHRTN